MVTAAQCVQDKTDDELIEEYKGLYDVVYNADCFNYRDLTLLSVAGKELEKRGYDISSTDKIRIQKTKET